MSRGGAWMEEEGRGGGGGQELSGARSSAKGRWAERTSKPTPHPDICVEEYQMRPRTFEMKGYECILLCPVGKTMLG